MIDCRVTKTSYLSLEQNYAYAFTMHPFGMCKTLWQMTQTREVLAF